MTDCPQCQEWELCPFHPKEKEPEPIGDYVTYDMTTLKGEWLVASPCGHYLQTWRDGKLVDEEPYESPSSIEMP